MVFLQPGRFQTQISSTLNHCNNSISREIHRNSFEVDMIQITVTARRKFAEKTIKRTSNIADYTKGYLE